MGVDYSLELCYGMIISEKTMNEIHEVLHEFDTFLNSYAHNTDCWSSDSDWFVGITVQYLGGTEDLVHEIDFDFLTASIKETITGAPWKEFSEFYNNHNLKEYFDWKPKLYLINFCY